MTRWGKTSIIKAIQDWHAIYGEPPRANDWQKSWRPDWVPSTETVKYHFGSWRAAIEAAGFQGRGRGAPAHRVELDRVAGRFVRG